MRKLIAMIGLPATGKSTIIKHFMEGLEWERKEPRPLVVTAYNQDRNLHIIGDYSDPKEKYPGTDRLSMAVQPEAIKFLNETDADVLFEGDRLGTSSFLEFGSLLVDQGTLEMKIIVVHADPLIVESRHNERADLQTEKFIKGRQTKIDNIRGNFGLMDYVTEFSNNNETQLTNIVNFLRLELFDDDVVDIL
jgi:dephospho-CoA kinase